MICKPCNVAGDLVAVSRQQNNFEDGVIFISKSRREPLAGFPTKNALAAVAELYHGICKGKSHCDCQHKIDFEGRTIQDGETR